MVPKEFFLGHNGLFNGEKIYDNPPQFALRADLLFTVRFLC